MSKARMQSVHSMANLSTAIAGVEVDSRPRRDMASGLAVYLAVSLMAIIIVVGCVGQSLRVCVCVYTRCGGGGGESERERVKFITQGGGGGRVKFITQGGWGR